MVTTMAAVRLTQQQCKQFIDRIPGLESKDGDSALESKDGDSANSR